MRGRAHRPAPVSPGPADPLTVSSPWSLMQGRVPKAARSMELSPETLTETGCHPQGRGAVAAGKSRPHPQFHLAPGSLSAGGLAGAQGHTSPCLPPWEACPRSEKGRNHWRCAGHTENGSSLAGPLECW